MKHYKPPVAEQRQAISLDEAKNLVASILDPREKCIVVTLLKTGVRSHELSELDVDDVDMADKTITLKPTKKRSNRTVFFDDEVASVLNRWLKQRENMNPQNIPALFLGKFGERMSTKGIHRIVVKHAVMCGLHNPSSDRKCLREKFSPHCCRYFFTTQLLSTNMKPKYVQHLKGDGPREAIDICHTPDPKLVQAEYEKYMPLLGIL